MTKRPRRAAKSQLTAGARLTDNEDAALEATRAALRCSRTVAVRQGLSLLSEACLAALASGVHVRSIDDLRDFLTEKLRPDSGLAP